MQEKYRSTQIGFSTCSASPKLENILNSCPSLALDIHSARSAVSNGLPIKDALELMGKNGPITTSRDSLVDNTYLVENVKLCLSSIAIGKCTEYPKN